MIKIGMMLEILTLMEVDLLITYLHTLQP